MPKRSNNNRQAATDSYRPVASDYRTAGVLRRASCHTDASLTDAKHWRVDGEPPRHINVAAPLLPRIEIINAWYGVRGSVEETRGGQVIARLCMNVLHNKGRLVLESNLDFNHFFGFDPAPNKKK